MKNNKDFYRILFGLILILCTSCANLKKVNDFSSSSLQSIKNFENIDYSFNQACNDAGKLERIRNAQFVLDTSKFDCGSNRIADSITLVIYNSIKGYFDGLTNLSNNDLTNYKLDTLATAFIKANVSDSSASAYAKISNILFRTLTNEYRKKKIQQYIGEANDAIKVLLNNLSFQLNQNLNGKLKIQEQKLTSIYYDLFQKANSPYEKLVISREYDMKIASLKNKEEQITSFAIGLQKISDGHQKLYEDRNKLTEKKFKDLISGYSSSIQDINAKFNKIKASKQ